MEKHLSVVLYRSTGDVGITMVSTPEQRAFQDTDKLICDWPVDFVPEVSRGRFVRIGETSGVSTIVRTRSWAVLADIYIVDYLGIRDTKDLGKYFGGPAAAELVQTLDVREEREGGLVFNKSPLYADPELDHFFPSELDELDLRSFYDFTCRLATVIDKGQDDDQKALLRRWMAGRKSGPKMVEHWGKSARFLIRQETAKLPS